MLLSIHKNKVLQYSAVLLLGSTLLISQSALAAPVANTDTYRTNVNQSITFNPLRNDKIDSGTYIFVRWATQPEGSNRGKTKFNANSITYTPPANFSGSTRLWYSIQDSRGARSGAHVKITVGNNTTQSSTYPVAANDNLTTRRDRPLTISPLVNDRGAGLRITAVNNYSTKGSRQRIVGSNQISYTPSNSASGADVFWYQITDNRGRKSAAKVTVAVTGVSNTGAYPTAGADTFTVDKNTTNNVFSVFRNDTGSGLSFSSLSSYSQKGGRTFNNGNSVIYDAPRNFVGTDQFWYAIKDSIGRTNAAKVTIVVKETNNGGNLPPNAVEDSLSTRINLPEFEIKVLANDRDPNGDALRIQQVQPARSGSVRLVNGRVLYTPPSTTASDTFRYTIGDNRGGTDSTSVTIGVRDPNDPNPNNPVVRNEFITMSAGQSVVIRVLDNDTDADGDTLSLDQVTSGSQGSTRKVADGNGKLNWVRYTALSTARGTDVFYYGVPDGRGGNGSGKVTITFR